MMVLSTQVTHLHVVEGRTLVEPLTSEEFALTGTCRAFGEELSGFHQQVQLLDCWPAARFPQTACKLLVGSYPWRDFLSSGLTNVDEDPRSSS